MCRLASVNVLKLKEFCRYLYIEISRFGTFGALMEYGIERRITPHSNLGATMLVGIPFGVTLKVKFTRASQTYTFPIHLADEV